MSSKILDSPLLQSSNNSDISTPTPAMEFLLPPSPPIEEQSSNNRDISSPTMENLLQPYQCIEDDEDEEEKLWVQAIERLKLLQSCQHIKEKKEEKEEVNHWVQIGNPSCSGVRFSISYVLNEEDNLLYPRYTTQIP